MTRSAANWRSSRACTEMTLFRAGKSRRDAACPSVSGYSRSVLLSAANKAHRLSLGLIAQEVEPLFPEVVGEHAGMKGLAYNELIPVTIRAVQELNQKVDSDNEKLRDELKHRDAENAELKRELGELKHLVGSLADKLNGGAK